LPRLTRAESQAQTRERLLEAARRGFVRDGYVKASLERMADDAGYSKGAIYSNFASKEALFLEILERKFLGELSQLRNLLDTIEDPEALIATIRSHYENSIEILDVALVAAEFLTQVSRGSPHAEACARIYAEQRAGMGELVQVLFRRAGRELPAPASEIATSLVAQTMGLAIQRGVDPKAVTPVQWGQAIELQLRGLLSAQVNLSAPISS
jgi:AcrR family transcriptional regulator